MASNTLVTAASVVATMSLGTILAFVVIFMFGKTDATDGLFTAYGVYSIVVIAAQSLRTTVVARLVEAPSFWAMFDRYIAAVLAIAIAATVPLTVLGGPLAHTLTGASSGDAYDTARTALWLFAIAACAQLLAGLGAAALAAFDRFVAVAIAYIAAGVISIIGVLVLAGPFDVTAVPIGIAAGSVLNAALIVLALTRVGWRPHRRALSLAGVGGRLWTTLAGAVLYATPQAIFVISLALAARIGSGAATVYTYAFFAASVVAGLSSGSVGIVLAAPVAQDWDRSPASLTPHLRTIVRLGATLTVPIIGAAALAGSDVAAIVFGSKLTASDTRTLAATFVALGGFMLAMVAVAVPQLAAFTLSRYRAVATIAIVVVLAHTGLSIAAAATDRLAVLGLAASASTVLMLIGLLIVVYESEAARPLLAVIRELVLPVALATVAFGAAWSLTLVVPGRAGDVALAVVGAGAYTVALHAFLPDHWQLVRRLVAPLARLRPTARQTTITP